MKKLDFEGRESWAVFFASDMALFEVMLKIFNVYEFADYVTQAIRKAVLFDEELTDLFNSELFCARTIITKEEIKEKLDPFLILVSKKESDVLVYELNVDKLISMRGAKG